MNRARILLLAPLAVVSSCSFMKPDPAGSFQVLVKEVPAQRLAVVERPGKSYLSIGKDLGRLATSPLWTKRAGPLQATYYVDTKKEKHAKPNSDAALPVRPGVEIPAPFVLRETPATIVAYAYWRKDVFRAFKTFPSIQAWAAANGWEVAGPPTEVYVTSGAGAEETAESVVEVRFPIRKR